MLNQVKQALKDIEVQYRKVEFPIEYVRSMDGVFVMKDVNDNPVYFRMTGQGKTYLLHSIGAYQDRKQFADYKEDGKQFASHVNRWVNSTDAQFETFILVLLPGKNDNIQRLYGMPKTYNIVDNETVVQMLEDEKLDHRLNGYSVGAYKSELYLSYSKNLSHFDWGVKVRNGLTGHVSLGFQGYIRIGDYEKTISQDVIVKHMGRVPNFFIQFSDFAQEVISLEIDEAFRTVDGKTAAVAALEVIEEMDTEEQEKVEDLRQRIETTYWEGMNALRIATITSTYIEYGRKPVVRKIMDAITDKVFEAYRASQ